MDELKEMVKIHFLYTAVDYSCSLSVLPKVMAFQTSEAVPGKHVSLEKNQFLLIGASSRYVTLH